MANSEEAAREWHVTEFVKDVVRLIKGNEKKDGTASIYHTTVPGGLLTIERALQQGLLIIKRDHGTFNDYQITFKGLMLYWEESGEVFLVSCPVADTIADTPPS